MYPTINQSMNINTLLIDEQNQGQACSDQDVCSCCWCVYIVVNQTETIYKNILGKEQKMFMEPYEDKLSPFKIFN